LNDRWVVILTPSARRDLRRLDRQVKRRVEQALDQLAADPAAAELRRLKGRPELRLRVREWRVLLELDHPARKSSCTTCSPAGAPTATDQTPPAPAPLCFAGTEAGCERG